MVEEDYLTLVKENRLMSNITTSLFVVSLAPPLFGEVVVTATNKGEFVLPVGNLTVRVTFELLGNSDAIKTGETTSSPGIEISDR
jgi:hypothetical protein